MWLFTLCMEVVHRLCLLLSTYSSSGMRISEYKLRLTDLDYWAQSPGWLCPHDGGMNTLTEDYIKSVRLISDTFSLMLTTAIDFSFFILIFFMDETLNMILKEDFLSLLLLAKKTPQCLALGHKTCQFASLCFFLFALYMQNVSVYWPGH